MTPALSAGGKPSALVAAALGEALAQAEDRLAPSTAAGNGRISPSGATTSQSMRRDSSSGGSSAMGAVISAADWSKGEKVAYERLYSEYQAQSPTAAGRFFDRSGLPERALSTILALAAPDAGPQEFWMCCRLIGHCQALQGKERNRVLLETGSGDIAGETKMLDAYLRERCMHRLPPQLPNFRRRPLAAPVSAT